MATVNADICTPGRPLQFAPSPLLTRLTNYVDSLPAEDKLGWIVPSEHTPPGAGDAHD